MTRIFLKKKKGQKKDIFIFKRITRKGKNIYTAIGLLLSSLMLYYILCLVFVPTVTKQPVSRKKSHLQETPFSRLVMPHLCRFLILLDMFNESKPILSVSSTRK